MGCKSRAFCLDGVDSEAEARVHPALVAAEQSFKKLEERYETEKKAGLFSAAKKKNGQQGKKRTASAASALTPALNSPSMPWASSQAASHLPLFNPHPAPGAKHEMGSALTGADGGCTELGGAMVEARAQTGKKAAPAKKAKKAAPVPTRTPLQSANRASIEDDEEDDDDVMENEVEEMEQEGQENEEEAEAAEAEPKKKARGRPAKAKKAAPTKSTEKASPPARTSTRPTRNRASMEDPEEDDDDVMENEVEEMEQEGQENEEEAEAAEAEPKKKAQGRPAKAKKAAPTKSTEKASPPARTSTRPTRNRASMLEIAEDVVEEKDEVGDEADVAIDMEEEKAQGEVQEKRTTRGKPKGAPGSKNGATTAMEIENEGASLKETPMPKESAVPAQVEKEEEEEEEFEVESVLDIRKVGIKLPRSVEYLIKFKGYDEPEWQPKECLDCQELINDFLSRAN
ncbi:hypothetical protein CYMTET_45391 [Cymbomonas tetramitiformis]|uniref:Chromo domain-containing protein n=1 Tax=Cymbomonas tetramitiformis TaxID=36881 RepID=A0AAE0EZQ6_9CHLO|nr:hypothetical protein CYMTET_45391 [Cymbomonas tetramitiformis]